MLEIPSESIFSSNLDVAELPAATAAVSARQDDERLALPADLADRIRGAVAADAALGALAPRLAELRVWPASGGGVAVDSGDPLLQERCARGEFQRFARLVEAQLPAPRPLTFPAPPLSATPAPAPWPADKNLEDFVPAANTRLAYHAVLRAARGVGPRYTPIIVVGGYCLGKTHLIQGFANAVRNGGAAGRVVAQNARDFVEEHARHAERGALDLFILHQTDADYFLIDDLHQLAAHPAAQETLLEIFERLHERDAQLLFTSLAEPGEVEGFCPRLASRMAWGITLTLQPVDAASRRELLLQRQAGRARRMPEEVVDHLARCELSTVRQIDSALRRVDELMDAGEGRPNMEQLRALAVGAPSRPETTRPRRTPALQDIEAFFLAYAKLGSEVMRSPCRSRYVAFPRQLAMYCSHEFTHASMEAIGQYYGGRDHSTVKYACEKIAGLIATDPRTRAVIDGFKAHFEI